MNAIVATQRALVPKRRSVAPETGLSLGCA